LILQEMEQRGDIGPVTHGKREIITKEALECV
jgi:hypothetical protein